MSVAPVLKIGLVSRYEQGENHRHDKLATMPERWSKLVVAAGFLFSVDLAHSLYADDGRAEMGAGGIEFASTPNVSMEREDLFLSIGKVKVAFEFKNVGKADFKTQVAFPLPKDLFVADQDQEYIAQYKVDHLERIASSFRVWVNEQPVAYKSELKSTLGYGENERDITSLLKLHGIPQMAPEETLNKLSLKELAELDAAGVLDSERHYPKWKNQRIFYWEQIFPVGKIIRIRHEYQPGIGGWYLNSEKEDWIVSQTSDWCVDHPTAKAMINRIHRLAPLKKADSKRCPACFDRLSYILKTARTWAGPIKAFHLTIEEPEDSITSTCFKGLVRSKVESRQFEVSRLDFTPPDEINVLFMDR